MRDIVFLDTETLGLHPNAPIWEFAGIRRFAQPVKGPNVTYTEQAGCEAALHFTIQHIPGAEGEIGNPKDLPPSMRDDYHARYDVTTAHPGVIAACEIWEFTRNAIIVGSNPGFDIERLAKLLQRNGYDPAWHYHPLDIASISMGFLGGRDELEGIDLKSDALAGAVGVDATDYARHTAMGDVLWTRAQWDATVGTWLRHA